MKPKGKPSKCPRGMGKGKGKAKAEVDDSQDGNLPVYLDLMPPREPEVTPKVTAIRTGDGREPLLDVDDLDGLQNELESMLLRSASRANLLRAELSAPSSGAESFKANAKPSSSKAIDSPSKEKFSTALKKGKAKNKFLADIDKGSRSNSPIGNNCDSPKSSHDGASSTPKPMRFRIYHLPNEFPDKFWQFVEEYCAPCTQDDLEYVEDLLKNYTEANMADYFKIPGLGKHYSITWSDEDKNKGKEKKRNGSSSPNKSQSPTKKLKTETVESDAHQSNGKNKCGGKAGDVDFFNVEAIDLGPMTQRLIQALVEEKPMGQSVVSEAALEDTSEAKDFPEMNGVNSSSAALMKSLNLNNLFALEKKIKRELESQGILDPEDSSDEEQKTDTTKGIPKEDEVTMELKKRQLELKELAEANRTRLQKLLEYVKTDLKRQKLSEKLKELDEQVIDISNRYSSCIPRKKLGKKEKDAVMKILKERGDLIKEVDKLPTGYF